MISCCFVLYCIVLYCVVLYCIVLYCIVLYHIIAGYVHTLQETTLLSLNFLFLFLFLKTRKVDWLHRAKVCFSSRFSCFWANGLRPIAGI